MLVASPGRPGAPCTGWEDRTLHGGSRWEVLKRLFDPYQPAAELGDGCVLHAGRYLVGAVA